VGLWDPSTAQKDALSFSISAVATTTVVVLPRSKARGQCEAHVKCVCVGEEKKDRQRGESNCVGSCQSSR